VTVTILVGDTRERLKEIPDGSVQCVVTSPPYFNLRDYQTPGQIGSEPTLAEYVATLVDVFGGIRRVLADDGTLWLNIGTSYANKCDLMVPARVAIAFSDDGWKVRSDIIWSKPNPMPESVQDRPTAAHEHIFLLTKSPRYYYNADAVRTPLKESSLDRLSQDVESQEGSIRANGGAKTNGTMKAVQRTDKQRGHSRRHDGFNDRWDALTKEEQQAGGANLRNVWHIATRPFSGAHFAVFPPEIPRLCIKAGSRPGDTVLDPFGGAGTTGLVADQLDRNAILIELNPDYAALAERRIHGDAPLFATVDVA
jgi:DNA modification methylase